MFSYIYIMGPFYNAIKYVHMDKEREEGWTRNTFSMVLSLFMGPYVPNEWSLLDNEAIS